jgi:hypothetical protein
MGVSLWKAKKHKKYEKREERKMPFHTKLSEARLLLLFGILLHKRTRHKEHERKEDGHEDTAHGTRHRADAEETITCTQKCSKDKDGNYNRVDSSEFL